MKKTEQHILVQFWVKLGILLWEREKLNVGKYIHETLENKISKKMRVLVVEQIWGQVSRQLEIQVGEIYDGTN